LAAGVVLIGAAAAIVTVLVVSHGRKPSAATTRREAPYEAVVQANTRVSTVRQSLGRKFVPMRARVDRVWRSPQGAGPYFIEWHTPIGRRNPSIKYEWPYLWSLTAVTFHRGRAVRDVLIRDHLGPISSGSDLAYADVTRDGRPDVLLAIDKLANHACGPRLVLAQLRGHVRVVYRRSFCETFWKPRDGGIYFDEAWWVKNDSVCCPTFRRLFTLQWNGGRFIRTGDRLVRVRPS
jgi:hypothetical protein